MMPLINIMKGILEKKVNERGCPKQIQDALKKPMEEERRK